MRSSSPWNSRLILTAAAFIVLAWPRSAHAQDPPTYVVKDVGVLSGASASRAYAINNFGAVVGDAPVPAEHAKAWQYQNDTLVDLSDTIHFTYWFPSNRGESYDISDAGQIVGGGWYTIPARSLPWRDIDLDVQQAFIARPAVTSDFATPFPGDAVTALGAFGPEIWLASNATSISNRNHVVGWADLSIKDPVPNSSIGYAENVFHAFMLVPGGRGFFVDDNDDGVNDLLVDLGVLQSGDQVSSATDVNDFGVVVGYSYGPGVGYTAFRVTPNDPFAGPWASLGANSVNSLMQSLGTLGTSTSIVKNSWARGINNLGVIVGESNTDELDTRAFVYEGGVMSDLGTLGGDDSSASAINDAGWIVGWAENTDRERRAVVWIKTNGVYDIYDLNDRIILTNRWRLTEARDINNSGEITGWGRANSSVGGGGGFEAFLLERATAEDIARLNPEDEIGDIGDGGNADNDGDQVDGDAEDTDLQPIFNTQGNQQAAQNDNDDATPVAAPAPLCGFGFLTMLPLTLLGMFGMKFRRYS